MKYFFSIYSFSAVYSHLADYTNAIKSWNIEIFPAEMATFYYYIGRLAILEEHYKEAGQYFEISLRLCDPTHERNISYMELVER